MDATELITRINASNGQINGLRIDDLTFDTTGLSEDISTIELHYCKIERIHFFTEVERELRIRLHHCRVNTLSFETPIMHRVEVLHNSTIETLNLYEANCATVVVEDSIIGLIHGESTLTKTLQIKRSKISTISLLSSLENLNIEAYDAEITTLELDECIGTSGIKLIRCQVSKIDITHSPLDFLRIHDNKNNCSLSVSGKAINLASLLRFTNASEDSIVFRDVAIDYLLVKRYSGSGDFDILNCSVKRFAVLDSVLYRGKLNSVDLRQAKQMSFARSNITNLGLFNIKWPEDYQLKEYEVTNTESIQRTWEVMESYRQLKSIHLHQSNQIESSQFAKNELRMFYKITKADVKGRRLSQLGNFLILWTSKYASDYGQSVWRPLILLFVAHGVFLGLLTLIHPELAHRFSLVPLCHHDWGTVFTWANMFAHTLLPTHPFVIDDVDISGIVDVCMRISSGYFIYYFLKAARRFHIT